MFYWFTQNYFTLLLLMPNGQRHILLICAKLPSTFISYSKCRTECLIINVMHEPSVTIIFFQAVWIKWFEPLKIWNSAFKQVMLYIHILSDDLKVILIISRSWSHSGIPCQFLAKYTFIIILVCDIFFFRNGGDKRQWNGEWMERRRK